MLISGGAAMLLACPRSLALGLLPLALARCVLGSTYAPATYAPVAFYAPAAYAPTAARGASTDPALGLRALRHARELTGGLAWRVLSKLPTPSEWLRWGGEACGKDGVLLAAPSAPPRQCHVGRGKAAAPS